MSAQEAMTLSVQASAPGSARKLASVLRSVPDASDDVASGLEAQWSKLSRVEAVDDARHALAQAGLDEGMIERVDLYDLARVRSAAEGQSARLVVPLVNDTGALRALASWPLESIATKSKQAPDVATENVISEPGPIDATALVMACSVGRGMLRTGKAPPWFEAVPADAPATDPRRLDVLVVSDVITFLLRASLVSDGCERPPAVVGLLGAWSEAMNSRVPDHAKLALLIPGTPTGDAIASAVRRTLAARPQPGRPLLFDRPRPAKARR